jgi:hypothetical protein
MHILAGGLTLAKSVYNLGFPGLKQQKPIVREEFGELQSDYPTEAHLTFFSWRKSSTLARMSVMNLRSLLQI